MTAAILRSWIGSVSLLLRPIAWALAVSRESIATNDDSPGFFEPRPWGWPDAVAIVIWTLAIVAFFWDAVSLRGALFLLRHHRDQLSLPRVFCRGAQGRPVFAMVPGALLRACRSISESQAGYLHPFKYLFYPWMETWKAFNLDTVLSIWLSGAGKLSLAAAARRANCGPFRRGHLRAERVHVGPLRAHQHDQRTGERAVRDLGA